MAYGDFKDLVSRIVSDKVLSSKAFNIARNTKYGEYKRDLPAMVYNFFKKSLLVLILLVAPLRKIKN